MSCELWDIAIMRDRPSIVVNAPLTRDQLFDFYERNDICERHYGKDVATRVLDHPHLIVAALAGDELVGLARATFDGLAAHVMEFSLDLRWQGEPSRYRNGSLIEDDPEGLGRALGEALLGELRRLGCDFVSVYLVEDCEERFYESIGFVPNTGHATYYIDRRPNSNAPTP